MPVAIGNRQAWAQMQEKIMLIDDDEALTRAVGVGLRAGGYRVESARNGTEGIRKLYQWQPNLVILDVMMPGMDGWEVCRRVRELSNVPVLMLTALDGEKDEVKGLDCGADSYLTKPFSMPVLLAHVEALLRRSRFPVESAKTTEIAVGDLRLDLARHQVYRSGRLVGLSPTEFRLLEVLASEPGQVVPHQELLTRVWGAGFAGELRYLWLYMRYLRQKLEGNPSRPRYVITVRGVGYYLSDGSSTMGVDADEPSHLLDTAS